MATKTSKSEHTIWKFPLKAGDEVFVEMPKGATILALQTQHDVPCLWAQVERDAPKIKRRFKIYGTDHPVPPEDIGLFYVGTFQIMAGALVFHVFTDRKEYPL